VFSDKQETHPQIAQIAQIRPLFICAIRGPLLSSGDEPWVAGEARAA
jgi:hypothetical protein